MPWIATEGSAHQIGDGDTIVGSGPHAAWRLVSHDLAAKHFILHRLGELVSVRAATAEGVVAVNGKQVATAPIDLKTGDTVDAGSVRFFFSKEKPGAVASVAIPPAHIVESNGGIVHPLDEPSIGIGRDRTNAILVRDPTASRFHAEVRREAGGWVLHPRGSSGTSLNGQRVATPARLTDGDRIEISHVEMRFVAAPPPSDAPRPAPPSTEDSDRGHRRTMIQSAVMQIPTETETREKKSRLWIWFVLAVVGVVLLYLAFR